MTGIYTTQQVIVSNGETDRDEEEEEEEEEEDEEDDEEGESMELQPSGRHRQLSEADLQTLETLEPDSSSQGSSGTMSAAERLEAAMSLSSLSVGLSVIEGRSGEDSGARHSRQEQQAVGVLVIMSAPDSLHRSNSLEHEDSGTRSLDSSMESESSRQLLEVDAVSSSESQSQLVEREEDVTGGAHAHRTTPGDAVSSAGGNTGSGPSSPSTVSRQSQPQQQQQQLAGEASNGSSSQVQSSNNSAQRTQQSSTTTGVCMFCVERLQDVRVH